MVLTMVISSGSRLQEGRSPILALLLWLQADAPVVHSNNIAGSFIQKIQTIQCGKHLKTLFGTIDVHIAEFVCSWPKLGQLYHGQAPTHSKLLASTTRID
ncbi:hypothetical protein ASPWEDRAFT_46537, partial [Aspergillus wentii DTO 134E9]